MVMKNISLLGSTGSIGTQTLDIARAHKDSLNVIALASGASSLNVLAGQIREFKPQLVSVPLESDLAKLKELAPDLDKSISYTFGPDGLKSCASLDEVDIVVTGVVGFLGVEPTLAAIRKGKTIALANKETMVAAGAVIGKELTKHNACIIPVDSEHSAIFQSMQGYSKEDLEQIWLTASGGPFRTWSIDKIKTATIDDALNHPNWSMGPKITVDSATMMNKGLEIIEARFLFQVDANKIKVVVHPESILHSAVQYVDGSIVGQLGVPDMRLPIHYALFYPERMNSSRVPRLNLAELGSLNFEQPDLEKFPCLKIAQQVASEDNTLACVLNAANEVIVESFLQGQIKFHMIHEQIDRILDLHKPISNPSLSDILSADSWARKEAQELSLKI